MQILSQLFLPQSIFMVLSESAVKKETLTPLGLYLSKKPFTQAKIARMTGIRTDRLSKLTVDPSTHLRVDELYLISLAINVDAGELMKVICANLKLTPESEW